MKKLLSVFFTTVIALSIICIAVFTSSAYVEVNIPVTTFDNMRYNIEHSSSNKKLSLYLDADMESNLFYDGIDFSSGEATDVTIDLNGHHIKFSTNNTDTNAYDLFDVNRKVNFTIIDSKNSSNAYIELNTMSPYSTIVTLSNAEANFTNYNVDLRKCYDTAYRANSGYSGCAVQISDADCVRFLGGSVKSFMDNDQAIHAGRNNSDAIYIKELTFAGNVELYSVQPSGNGTLTFFNSNIADMNLYSCKITCGTVNKLAVYNASGAKYVDLIGDKQNLYSVNGDTSVVDTIKNGTYVYKGNFVTEFNLEYKNCGTNVHISNTAEYYHVFLCNNCNGFTRAEAHTETTIPSVAATCTESGNTEGTKCSVCNYVIQKPSVIYAKGHKPEAIPGTPSTCDEIGLTDGTKCSVCNEILVAQTRINALGHSYGSYITTKKATYFANGVSTATCSRCSGTVTKPISKVILGKTQNVSGKSTATSVVLNWSKVTGATAYRVYQYKSGSWAMLKDVTTNTYTVSKLASGTTYTFRVRAYVKSGSSVAWGATSTSYYTSTLPAAPTSLNATQTVSSIKLSWARVTGATLYRVYRYISTSKTYVKVADVTTNSCTVKSLSAGTTYYFVVRACKTYNSRNYWGSNSAMLKTTTLPTYVTSLKAKTVTKTSVTMSWSKVTGATGYAVFQYKGGKWVRVAVVKTNAATIKSLKSATNQYFKIRAYKTYYGKNYYGAYSSTLKVRTK